MKMTRFFILLLFVLAASFAAKAARTDTIYLYNGDRITGEIKYLRDNKLSYKTDRAGIIAIEWPSVAKIYSENYFDIVTVSKERLFGRFGYSDTAGNVTIELGSFIEERKLSSIIGIERIKSGFFDQLTGTISMSASYTNANENLQLNAGFDITHRSRKYNNSIKANTVLTNNANSEQTQRSEASYALTRFYNSPWFASTSITYQSNTELNIDSRYQLYSGAGYFLFRKPGKDFFTATGLSINREQSIAEPVTVTENLEYVAAIRFHQFKFRNPQLDILADLSTYTSLTTAGRFRFDFQLTLLWELFNDFKWNVTLYDNFDNKPPGGSELLNDWNLLTGITYTL